MRKLAKYLALIVVFALVFSGSAMAKPNLEDKGKGHTVRERILERIRERHRDFGSSIEEMLDQELMDDEEVEVEEDVEELEEEMLEEEEDEVTEETEQDADQTEEEEALEEAEEEYEGLVRLEEQLRLRLEANPDDAKALRKLAIVQKNLVQYDESKYEDALESARQLLDHAGERHKAMIILAQTYRLKGDIESAMTTLDEVLETYPDTKVRAYLAILQEEAGEVEEAVENMEQAVQEEPDNLEYYEALGRMYHNTNRFKNMVKVFVKGKMPQFDVPPVIKDGRTLIPVRAISNALGAQVDWDPENRIVTIIKDDKTITLQIDSHEVYVNGVPVSLDVPATIIDGRTMVPGRFVSEAFNAVVHWIGEYQTVVINTPEEADEAEDDATEENTDEAVDETTDGTEEVTEDNTTGQETGDTTGDSTQQDGEAQDLTDTQSGEDSQTDTQSQ